VFFSVFQTFGNYQYHMIFVYMYIVDAACIVCCAGSMLWSGVCLSMCLSNQSMVAMAAGEFAAGLGTLLAEDIHQ